MCIAGYFPNVSSNAINVQPATLVENANSNVLSCNASIFDVLAPNYRGLSEIIIIMIGRHITAHLSVPVDLHNVAVCKCRKHCKK